MPRVIWNSIYYYYILSCEHQCIVQCVTHQAIKSFIIGIKVRNITKETHGD